MRCGLQRHGGIPLHLGVLVVLMAAVACEGRPEGSQQTPEAGQESTELSGCYDVTEGEWVVEQTYPGEDPYPVPSEYGYDSVDYQIPPRIQFAGPSDRQPSAIQVVVPEGALPTPHRYAGGEIIAGPGFQHGPRRGACHAGTLRHGMVRDVAYLGGPYAPAGERPAGRTDPGVVRFPSAGLA